jgi:dipeptidyl-peptidase-3
MYVACIFGNYGNYKSFGDSKMIPNVSQSDFETILKVGPGTSSVAAGCASTPTSD